MAATIGTAGFALLLAAASHGDTSAAEITRWSRSTIPEAIAAPQGTIDPYLQLVGFWDGDRPIAYHRGGYETSPEASFVAPSVERVLMAAMEELLKWSRTTERCSWPWQCWQFLSSSPKLTRSWKPNRVADDCR